ncbi:MAG: hypothetical protein MR794_00105 [Bacteroidales bacterium]|nr:hypothetical protein [Bacteroidales bacterium]
MDSILMSHMFEHLIPEEYPQGKEHLLALYNIENAMVGVVGAMHSNVFFSEACHLIANAISLFRSGYFDCAFYSLRSALELSIETLYITEKGEDEIKKWAKQEDGFEQGTMVKYLIKNASIYANMRAEMADYFEGIRKIQLRLNKYIHKQGLNTFYAFHAGNMYVKSKRKRLNDFDVFVTHCIGAVAVYRLAIDPLPIILTDEKLLYKSPNFITEPYSDDFIKTYIGLKHIECYKKTQIYKDYYTYINDRETQNEGVFMLIHGAYYDRNYNNAILKQFHLLSFYEQMAVVLFSVSTKISNLIINNVFYSSNIKSKRVSGGITIGESFFNELFGKYPNEKTIEYYNVFLTKVKVCDEWEYIEHNEKLNAKEQETLTEIAKIFSEKYKSLEAEIKKLM